MTPDFKSEFEGAWYHQPPGQSSVPRSAPPQPGPGTPGVGAAGRAGSRGAGGRGTGGVGAAGTAALESREFPTNATVVQRLLSRRAALYTRGKYLQRLRHALAAGLFLEALTDVSHLGSHVAPQARWSISGGAL
eukprot:gene3112-biopygen23163